MEKFKLLLAVIISLSFVKFVINPYLLARNLLQYTILKKYYEETALLMIL